MNGQIELVTDAKAALGEGPHWDQVEGKRGCEGRGGNRCAVNADSITSDLSL
ncbi:hypothetical protein [Paenibacillus phytohabitans]|uniref:hypothetical protein n=1 Tax=Paenibacillus phytohabitans TaxID=2654978 RepID=UPI0014911CC0|nr:hypothetical protein [Paenibacillus phytohabitans]